MDLTIVITFLVLYYLRPQEWSPVFATVHFIQIVMLGGVATLFIRKRGLGFGDLFRTPHDWAVFGFWFWIVISAVHPWDTFKDNANLYIFYIVIVQALNSIPRLKMFVGTWTMLIVMVAFLALASKWGFDPLDSLEQTVGPMKGRLILNLSIFNNPNGLGHSVLPAIPMLYYYFIWNRPLVSRAVGFALLLIPLGCIYETFSKGSFLCGAVTIFATLAFGRPRIVQVFIVAFALVFGTGLLYSLPRMNDLHKTKNDGGIQGRVLAFKHGYELLQGKTTGIGKAEWSKDAFITDYLPVATPPKAGDPNNKGRFVLRPFRHNKAPHSSYVCIGAELGRLGLFLFIAVLYSGLRTTITAKTSTPDEERIRRMLFVLVVSYIVSSWMVDFEYRPTFFMFTAAIAALHRHLSGMLDEDKEVEEEPDHSRSLPVWYPPQLIVQPELAVALADSRVAQQILATEPGAGRSSVAAAPRETSIGWNWNRFSLFDIAMITVLTAAVIRFWAYIMLRM